MRTTGFKSGGRNVRWLAWCVLAVVAVAVSVITAVRWRETARLREEITAQVRRQNEAAGLSRANQAEEALAVASEADVERLRADRGALPRLRAEVSALRKSVDESRPKPAKKPNADPAVPLDIEKEIVPSDAWRNAGYATPAAAVETALWAAAGGDTDLLAKSFILENGAERKAEELWATLPEESRKAYAHPAELVAFMTAKDVPLEGARIITSEDQPEKKQRVAVQMRNAAGSVRQVQIELRETPEGWRPVVPESVVARYARELKSKAPPTAATGR